MQLKLSCIQLKTDYCNYKMVYISFLGEKKKKPVVGTQKTKRKESKHTTTKISSNHTGRQQEKNRKTELQNFQKAMNKLVIVSPYLLIFTFNVNTLNSSIKRYRVAE